MNMRYFLSIRMRKCNTCYLSVSALFIYICECVMSFSVLLFSEFEQMHIKMFQKLRGSDSLFFLKDLDLGIASIGDK